MGGSVDSLLSKGDTIIVPVIVGTGEIENAHNHSRILRLFGSIVFIQE